MLFRVQILAKVFYEPSTRTQSSFISAMQRLGGSIIPLNQVRHVPDQALAPISMFVLQLTFSIVKGETLKDTMVSTRTLLLRHPEKGAVSDVSSLYNLCSP